MSQIRLDSTVRSRERETNRRCKGIDEVSRSGEKGVESSVSDRWPGVELRHFAALRAVAAERSFHGAARRLGYTQSAVSQQIAALERAVGARLVERPGGPNPVALTEAGDLLLQHAQGIAARVATVQADFAAYLGGSSGLLRIGVYQSVGARLMPDLLSRFAQLRPEVKVDLMEAASDGVLIEALEEGAIDLALVDLPLPDGPFGAVELLRDPCVLVVQADSPLAARKLPPRLEELGHLPLLAFRTGRCMPRILRSLADEGITPRIVLRSDHNETLQGLAAAGMGVALMPSLAVDFGDTRTAAVELGELLAPRLIGLAWQSERRHMPLVATFVDFTTKLYRDGSGRETLERRRTELSRA
jgi:DNA-binding transcriptional LysR family regulator